MKLSIVATLYKSSPYIPEFHRRASSAARQFSGDDYEIILVNDGSPDNSLDLAVQLVERDPHVSVVDLSRNFGHHKAMMTGLAHAKGEYVFLIDTDLEDEPEWLASFSQQMLSTKCDVVYGVQERRKGGFFEQWSGRLFYKIFRVMTGLNLPDNVVVARLMSRRYVDALLLHGESEMFMAGLWVITGFEQIPITIRKNHTGDTTYTFRKKVSQFVNSVTAFTNTPLLAIFFVGCLLFFVSGVFATYLISRWLFMARPPSGYTSLMVSVWLLGGMITAFLGIIGIYLSKIYTETKRRPYTIVRNVFSQNHGGNIS